MKNTTHRVVILKNVNSDIISQAILILKNPDGFCESAVLAEAERVVEKYMQGYDAHTEKNKGRFMVSFLGVSFVLFSALCIYTILKIL